jgi:hypothetical protein
LLLFINLTLRLYAAQASFVGFLAGVGDINSRYMFG